MAESEGIQEIVNQAAIQAVTAVTMVLRDADSGPQSATKASPRQPKKAEAQWTSPRKAVIKLV